MAPLFLSRVTAKIPIAIALVLTYPLFASYLFYGGEKGVFWNAISALGLTMFLWSTASALLELSGRKPLGTLLEDRFGLESTKAKALPLVALWVLVGVLWSNVEFEIVRTVNWGGLFVTLVISGIGITFGLLGDVDATWADLLQIAGMWLGTVAGSALVWVLAARGTGTFLGSVASLARLLTLVAAVAGLAGAGMGAVTALFV